MGSTSSSCAAPPKLQLHHHHPFTPICTTLEESKLQPGSTTTSAVKTMRAHDSSVAAPHTLCSGERCNRDNGDENETREPLELRLAVSPHGEIYDLDDHLESSLEATTASGAPSPVSSRRGRHHLVTFIDLPYADDDEFAALRAATRRDERLCIRARDRTSNGKVAPGLDIWRVLQLTHEPGAAAEACSEIIAQQQQKLNDAASVGLSPSGRRCGSAMTSSYWSWLASASNWEANDM